MTAQVRIILFSSVLFFGLGFFVPESELLMMQNDEAGELFKPVSSGSDDPFALKLGFIAYIISAIYVCFCLITKTGYQAIKWVYLVNGLFFCLSLCLIHLDSDFVVAYREGNGLPLGLTLFWAFIVLVVLLFSFITDKQAEIP